jgi:protein-tyrosine phosphatase
MFSFFRRSTKSQTNLSGLRCDMHSHLIPGVDDGAPDPEGSMRLINGMIELGYKKIITTPHIMWEMHKNTRETIMTGCETVRKMLSNAKIPMEFGAAAEYYTDEHFEEALKNEEPLLTLKDKLLLIEFSIMSLPLDLKKILFSIQIKGYQPIIAHPERYMYFSQRTNWFDEMRAMGCMFQLNVLSLTGFYGKGPLETCHYLIRKKYVDFIGTDLHHERHLKMIMRSADAINPVVSKLLDSGALLNPTL